jgi:hypothetical protein
MRTRKIVIMAGTAAALALAGCGSTSSGGTNYTESNNPCVNSRMANGTWQQQGISRAVAQIEAVTLCDYGHGFDSSGNPGLGVGSNTSGWSVPGDCSPQGMPACLNN